ncbi:MAG: helix-turn-helix transcriptional regulator, partial [Planctomycetota bacterium JB042]
GTGDLTVELLESARAAFGDEGIERLIEVRTERQLATYAAAVPSSDAPLSRRVAALARLRDREGYLAEWSRTNDGAFLLVENHCPICIAATACQGLCAGELRLFRRTLGDDVEVERTEHLLDGARRCAYRIAPRADA